MFKRRGTIIAEGLKIIGRFGSGSGRGQWSNRGDVHCTSLFISPKAAINGDVEADRVVVNGKVEGHIRSSEVVLKSHAHVVGDVQCQRLFIERGAYFDGRSKCSPQTDMRTAPATLTASVRKANELKATREPVDASAA